MNGFGHLPSKIDQNTFVFYANASTSTSGSFQAWSIPEHASFLHFTVIGGGGGGGGGCGGTPLASGRAGGGGGAPGGLVAVSIPTILLPKTLYLQVGYGGAPGTGSSNQAISGQSGNNGTISYVCLYPEINAGSVLIQSSNTAPGGGVGGGSVTAATGTAITIADTTNLKWLGIVGNTVAQTAGGTGTVNLGTSVTYAGLLSGGAGGGGKPANNNHGGTGGSQVTDILNQNIAVNVAGGAGGIALGTGFVNGNNGSNGSFSWRPFIATGGAGGGAGSIGAFNGGGGGKGAYGCGGGGGGAAGNLAGSGGPGGDGLIVIAIG